MSKRGVKPEGVLFPFFGAIKDLEGIGIPCQHDPSDHFGIKVYQDALIDFVKHTDTPITIALQGEWGNAHSFTCEIFDNATGELMHREEYKGV